MLVTEHTPFLPESKAQKEAIPRALNFVFPVTPLFDDKK
jgi:hypothetical protein